MARSTRCTVWWAFRRPSSSAGMGALSPSPSGLASGRARRPARSFKRCSPSPRHRRAQNDAHRPPPARARTRPRDPRTDRRRGRGPTGRPPSPDRRADRILGIDSGDYRVAGWPAGAWVPRGPGLHDRRALHARRERRASGGRPGARPGRRGHHRDDRRRQFRKSRADGDRSHPDRVHRGGRSRGIGTGEELGAPGWQSHGNRFARRRARTETVGNLPGAGSRPEACPPRLRRDEQARRRATGTVPRRRAEPRPHARGAAGAEPGGSGSGYQRTPERRRGRNLRAPGSVPEHPRLHRGHLRQGHVPNDVPGRVLRGAGRPGQLRRHRRGLGPPGGEARRQDPQGRQAGRPAGRTADEVRARHQCEDRQGARSHDPTVAAAAGGSTHSMRVTERSQSSWRVTPITTKDQVAPEHRPVFDAVAEGRGSVRGPFSIMMYSPPMCERVLNTSNFLRFQSSVKPKEAELAIVATAREKDCPFVWAAHVTLARKAGTREEAITAVRDRKDVSGLAPDERAIVSYVRQLLRANRVDQAVFDALKDRYGVPWVVELTGIIGHYGLVTGLLNAFEMAPAPDAEQLPV